MDITTTTIEEQYLFRIFEVIVSYYARTSPKPHGTGHGKAVRSVPDVWRRYVVLCRAMLLLKAFSAAVEKMIDRVFSVRCSFFFKLAVSIHLYIPESGTVGDHSGFSVPGVV